MFAVRVPSALSIHHDRRVKVKSVCLFGIGLSLAKVVVCGVCALSVESVLRSVSYHRLEFRCALHAVLVLYTETKLSLFGESSTALRIHRGAGISAADKI